MKVVIQRVKSASVSVDGGEPRRIGPGLMCLFGAGSGDDGGEIKKLADKTAFLRIFTDSEGKMNLSAAELGLSALVVPNFTLYADTRKGLRPSFAGACEPERAKEYYETYTELLRGTGLREVKTGEFASDMLVNIENDGPVTVILDTEEWKR